MQNAPSEAPQLVRDEVPRSHERDRDRLSGHLRNPDRDEGAEEDEVRTERHGRDDEKPEALDGDVAALVTERPEAVPGVVVRDGDEERAARGDQLVNACEDERREHGEIDDVAREADGAELRELDPIGGSAECDRGGVSDLARARKGCVLT